MFASKLWWQTLNAPWKLVTPNDKNSISERKEVIIKTGITLSFFWPFLTCSAKLLNRFKSPTECWRALFLYWQRQSESLKKISRLSYFLENSEGIFEGFSSNHKHLSDGFVFFVLDLFVLSSWLLCSCHPSSRLLRPAALTCPGFLPAGSPWAWKQHAKCCCSLRPDQCVKS